MNSFRKGVSSFISGRNALLRYSSSVANRNKAHRMTESFRNSTLQIFDPYIPPSRMPSLFSSEGRALWKTVAGKWTRSVISYVTLWKDKISVSRKEIPYTAERLYATMNEAIAEHDFSKLKKCTTPSMFSLLSEKLLTGAAKRARFEWKDEGAVSKTKLLHTVIGEVPIDSRTTIKRMQVTVSIHRRQSVRIAGNNSKEPIVKDVKEYIVLERDIEDRYSDWLIAGKLKSS